MTLLRALIAIALIAFAVCAPAQDTAPDFFSFIDQCSTPASTPITSNTVTITGIDTPAAIGISGGGGTAQYSIGCTASFTNASGTIANGQTVCVRHTSASGSGAQSSTLTVGTFSDTFATTNAPSGCDATPDPFRFVDQSNAPLSTVVVSAPVTIQGLGVASTVSISGNGCAGGGTCTATQCGYSIGCTGTYTTASTPIGNGQTLCVRHTSAASYNLTTRTGININGVCDDFASTTNGPDSVPDAFAFADQTAVPPSATITSAAITASGINQPAAISVSGAAGSTYSIGCSGAFTSGAGSIGNGQTVCVRHTSPATFVTATSTTLTIGGVSDTFTSTTRAQDIDPSPFAFVDATGVPVSTVVTSNALTISGLDSSATLHISAAGSGQSSVPCGVGWSNADRPISNGQSFCVRHTSASAAATALSTAVTVGTYTDVFTSVTAGGGDSDPDPFAFADQVDVPTATTIASNAITITGIDTPSTVSVLSGAGSQHSVGCTGTFTSGTGTISNGQSICVRHGSGAGFSNTVTTTLVVGTRTGTFRTTTIAQDLAPDPFAFADQPGVALGAVVTSAAAAITGINDLASISVAGASGSAYSIGCTATYTSAAGTISNGQTVCVRHTAASSNDTARTTTLTVGTRAATFTSITLGNGGDTFPDPFELADRTEVTPGATIVSAAITISGLNAPTQIFVNGGACGASAGCAATSCGYSIGCTGTFTASAGTTHNNQTVCVRHIAAAGLAATVDTALTIGAICDTFSSTTVATADTVPDPFVFADVGGVPLSSTQTSNAVTITGINAPATVTVAGGSYAIGCVDPFVTGSGSILNGQTICVRHLASSSNSTATNTTLTIGGISDTFTSTTVAAGDTTPAQFTFTDVLGVALSTPITSGFVTINAINSPAPISVSGAASSLYSLGCSSSYTNAPGTVTNGQPVCVRHISAATPGTATHTTLNVGGVTDTFTSTTVAADTNPDAFAFAAQTGVALSTPVTSNAVTVVGIDAPAPIGVAGGGGSAYSIGCTASFVTGAGTIAAGQTVCVRHTSAAGFSTATSTTLTIGTVAATFTSTTLAADTDPAPFAFTDQTGVPLSAPITSNAVTIGGIDAAAPISVAGASGSAYSIGCTASFTGAPGTIASGQTVCVRHTSAATNSTAASTTLTIGSIAGTFTSTTAAIANTPPTLAYVPAPGTTVTLAGGAASIGVASNADGSGAGAAATTSFGACAIGGPGAAAFGAPTLVPAPLAFVGATPGSGVVGLSCARAAVAASATLDCSETPGVVRSWPLTCPALPPPAPQVFGTTFQISCSGDVVGRTTQTLTFSHNDADENPAQFTVQCNVAQSPLVGVMLKTMFATDSFNDVLFANGFE